ncbi:MAG: hypothetical protein AABZ74_13780 [Cyanobacteriota bacterium]
MRIDLIEKELGNISELLSKKQFLLSEKKIRTLLHYLKPEEKGIYDYYIKAILLLSEILIKNIKNINALEELEHVFKEFPFEERILLEIYNLSVKLRMITRAEMALKSIIYINPSDISKRIFLVRFYLSVDENSKAIMELKKIIELGIFDYKIHTLLASSYIKIGLYSESLKHVEIMKSLEPEKSYLNILESKVMLDKNNLSESFKLFNVFIEQKLDEKKIDNKLLLLLNDNIDLFIKTSQKDILIEHIIKILSSEIKYSSENILFLNKITKKLKVDVIFNFFTHHNNPKSSYPNLTDFDLLLNLIFLIKNKEYFNQDKFNLKKYFEPIIEKILPLNLHIFIQSLLYE